MLVAAFRADHSHHALARRWLLKVRQECRRGTATLVLLLPVMAGFLRLVTNARVFEEPDTPEDAVAFLDALLTTPGMTVARGADDWPLLRALVLDKHLHGNLVTDAWIAATTKSRGEHLVTFDRDFRRLLSSGEVTVLS